MTLADRWSRWLDDLRVQKRYRELRSPQGHDFASNDYLGYSRSPWRDPEPALPRSGTAARLLRGNHPLWPEVESLLAAWHGAAAALMFSSGYTANEGLLATVITPDDWVASDELNHASIIDGLRLARAERYIYRHHDLDQLEAGLRSAVQATRPGQQRFIVTESLFGMEGDRCPLAEIVTLAERYGAHVIVDEAHATGCFGPTGSGLVDALGLRPRVLASVHTGGKALATLGAYIAGSSQLRDVLVNRCRHFIFTTALPAVAAGWWLQAIARARADHAGREQLHALAVCFRQELARHGIAAGGTGYIVPVIVGRDAPAVAAAEQLQAEGFDIRAIRPPSVPVGTARLRISIHADHSPEVIQRAAAAVARAVTFPKSPA